MDCSVTDVLRLGCWPLLHAAPRAAIWLSIFGIVLSLAVGAAIIAYVLSAKSYPAAWFHPDRLSLIDVFNIGVNLLVAIGVWIAVRKVAHVEKAGPGRLLGYVVIWLFPILVSTALAMSFRFTVMQPFHIPSGAMQPTLNVGDYIVASKSSYGYSRFSLAPFEALAPPGRWRAHDPERGDIAVFRPVPEPGRDFVKRIVGLPGDRIQMIGGVLHINGQAVQRESVGVMTIETDYGAEQIPGYRETLPNGVTYTTLDRGETELDNTRVFQVPQGHYFMMGDDRDNSADSRVTSVVGFVPFDHLVGRVDHIVRAEH